LEPGIIPRVKMVHYNTSIMLTLATMSATWHYGSWLCYTTSDTVVCCDWYLFTFT